MSGAGKLVMLDPNIRPGFIADEDRYRARMERLLSLADVVKVSDEDLAWLMGDGDTGALAEAMRARGPAIVLVTEGAEGVTAHGGDDPCTIPPRRPRSWIPSARATRSTRASSPGSRTWVRCRPTRCARACPRTRSRRARPRRARRRRHRAARAPTRPKRAELA
jgi:hypothetical protein